MTQRTREEVQRINRENYDAWVAGGRQGEPPPKLVPPHIPGWDTSHIKRAQDRSAIADRAQKLANEIAQLFADADHWNSVHPHDQAIDPDPDGQLRRTHESLVAFLSSEPAAEVMPK